MRAGGRRCGPILPRVLTAVGVKPDMAVMDLCSGDGWFTLQIAKLARHVVAIDIDADLLDVARHRLAESGVDELRFRGGERIRTHSALAAAG